MSKAAIPDSPKKVWQKAIAKQKDANNMLSDRLRAQRRVIEAQAKEIEEMCEAWPKQYLDELKAIREPVTIKDLAESA